MSPRALASEVCVAECLVAQELNKPLYTAYIETCAPEEIWTRIKLIPYADLRNDFNNGLTQLINAISKNESLEAFADPIQTKVLRHFRTFEELSNRLLALGKVKLPQNQSLIDKWHQIVDMGVGATEDNVEIIAWVSNMRNRIAHGQSINDLDATIISEAIDKFEDVIAWLQLTTEEFQEGLIEDIVDWFLINFTKPNVPRLQRDKYKYSVEALYYPREEIEKKYNDIPYLLLEQAIERIEIQGKEWVRRHPHRS